MRCRFLIIQMRQCSFREVRRLAQNRAASNRKKYVEFKASFFPRNEYVIKYSLIFMTMKMAFTLFFKIYLFIYFWLRWVFVAARRLSLVVVSRGYSSLRCMGFSLRWLLLLRSTDSRHTGFSSCGAWAQ